jgi:hypothetical protein
MCGRGDKHGLGAGDKRPIAHARRGDGATGGAGEGSIASTHTCAAEAFADTRSAKEQSAEPPLGVRDEDC